ncbi:calmodulin-binding protein 60 B-like isoform X2 [Punica granatum]|uniref:Calmodulin-binding protein 60 B-like isoform X2 n=1 Tax=Punica granatum TaxID=22663 RepID=A0A6P8CC58_PUNGR|nr:calmodulin-binding protein 60 B-like isoform X2 [Punica granatum]
MATKRQSQKEGESGRGVPDQNPNNRPASELVRNVFGGISHDDAVKIFEPFFRKTVREQVEHLLPKILGQSSRSGSSSDPTGTAHGVVLKLRFVNKLPATLFTGSKIEAEDKSPVMIELIDSRTNTRVTSDPLSSAKVLIQVLDGDIGSDNGEDLSEGKFNSKIVRKREGRRPLITGDLTITLRAGLGSLPNITFTDNSSWIRSRRFRLGARISQNIPIGVMVKEAFSGSFMVKDHRGEVYKKHHPPHPKDEVWRLEKIAKDRVLHRRLASKGIHKVEDFLRLLETKPSLLKTIICKGTSSKMWEAIEAHARACVIDDDQAFAYFQESTNTGLLLNSVYRVVKATFDGCTYIPVQELTLHQKALVQNLKRQAYENMNQLIPVSGALAVDTPQPMSGLSAETFLAPQEYPPIPLQGYIPMSHSALYGSEGLGIWQSEVSGPQMHVPPDLNFTPTVANSFAIGNIQSGDFNGGISFPSSSKGPAMTSTCFPSTSGWVPENGFFFGSSSGVAGEGGTFPSVPDFGLVLGPNNIPGSSLAVHNGRSRVAWCKVRAAFKLRSMRKVAARRRRTLASAARSMSCF